MTHERLTATAFAEAGLHGWTVLLHHATTVLRPSSFTQGAELVREIALLADAADHHPDLDLRHGALAVRLTTHDAGGLTTADLALAQAIDAVAGRRGVPAEAEGTQVLEIAVDAARPARVRPFWAAALGYVTEARGEEPPDGQLRSEGEAGADDGGEPDDVPALRDPLGIGPSVWFQHMVPPRSGRNRLHLDVNVAPSLVRTRLEAATAAGGTVVNDSQAPAFWVLADPEGNEVCLCTWEGRDD